MPKGMHFFKRSFGLNTPGSELAGLAWTDKPASAFVCGKIHAHRLVWDDLVGADE